MILIYVDESGVPSLKDPDPIFILNAVLIKIKDYLEIERDLKIFKRDICKAYKIPDKNFEIHMSQLYKDQGKKVFHKQLILKELQQIYNSIYKSMVPNHNFKIISVVFQKDKIPKGTKENRIMHWVLEDLLERIELCLLNEYRSQGIFFMDDMNKTKCVEFRELFNIIIKNGTYNLKEFQRLQPFIHFLDSASNDGIQISDLITYIIRQIIIKKIYLKGNANDTINKHIFNSLIKPKIRGYPTFIGFGLKIIPEPKIKI
jgi:hypothetical protein